MAIDTAFEGTVVHPAGEGVVYGPDALRRQLAGLVAKVGAARPFVVTTGSVERAGLVDEIGEALGNRPVGVFAGSREHTPAPVVLEAATAVRRAGADCLVSLGGSSVVDLTKGVALVLAEGEDLDRLRVQFQPGVPSERPALDRPKLPHLSVPTTLSGAEFTGAAGITDPVVGEKRIYVDPKLAPRWVVLDPQVARATPPWLWASTGMKALADTVEVLCSRRATPLSDAVASGALALLLENLALSAADPDDLVARGRCQFAVAMALPQLAAVGPGLVAGLRHQLGGGLGVAHGVASTIVLPHVLRWNLPACEGPLTRGAAAVGLAGAGPLVERIAALTAELGLPTRLRDVGVKQRDLDGVAAHVLADGSIATNPRPITAREDVLEVLQAAW